MAIDEIASTTESEQEETQEQPVEAVQPQQKTSMLDFVPKIGATNENPMTSEQIFSDPESILKDPMSSDEQKMEAIKIQTANEQTAQKQKEIDGAKDLNNFKAWQQDVQEKTKFNVAAAAKGYAPVTIPGPDKYGLDPKKLDVLSQQANQAALGPEADKQREEQERLDEEARLAEEARQAELALKKQEAQNMGAQKALMDIETQKQQRFDEAIKLVNEQDSQLDAIDPNRFWNNKSTFEKILGTIAIGMGAGAAGDGPNKAYEIINDAIKRDVDAQKITGDQKLAKQANALKRVQLEIEKFEAMSKDQERKANLQATAQKLAADRQAIHAKLATDKTIAQAVTSGKGISPEQAEIVFRDNPQMAERQVVLPNGRIKVARTKAQADELGKYVAASKSAIALTKELRNAAEELSFPDRLQPAAFNSLKTKSTQIAKSLQGQLRLPFMGPGILDVKERQMLADDIIGDPTTVWKRPQVVRDQLESLDTILNVLVGSQYEAAGIGLTPTPEQKALKGMLERGIREKVPMTEIKKAAQKLGYIK